MKLDFHEYANLFPTIVRLSEKGQPIFVEENEEWRDFVADIRINGQQEPIVLYEGKILDGRNRYLACLELGLKPKTTEYKGDDPLAYVLSTNLHRRHLTKSQRAVLALDLLPYYEAENREAHRVGSGTRANPGEAPKEISERDEEGLTKEERESSARAARATGTNRVYVQQVKKIAKEAPEEIEKIKRGEATVSGVVSRLKKEEAEREAKRRAKAAEAGRIKEQQESINPPLESAAKYLNMATEHMAAGARLAGQYGWTYLDLSVRDKLAKALDRLESAVADLPWGEEDESE